MVIAKNCNYKIILKGKVVKFTFSTKKFITKITKNKKNYKKLEKNNFLEMSGCSLNTLNTLRIRQLVTKSESVCDTDICVILMKQIYELPTTRSLSYLANSLLAPHFNLLQVTHFNLLQAPHFNLLQAPHLVNPALSVHVLLYKVKICYI